VTELLRVGCHEL